MPTGMEREEELARKGGQTYVADGTGPVAVRRLQRAGGVIDFAACEANQAAGGKAGVVLDHFNFCRHGFNTLTKLDGQGRVEGQVKFTEIEVGTGMSGARKATIYVKTKDLRAYGVFSPSFGTKMTIKPGSGGSPAHPGSCVAKMDTGATYTDVIGAWGDKFLAYDVQSPEANASTSRIDKVAACTFQTHYKVEGSRGASPWSNGPDGGLRFDSADYLAPYGTQGAIFDRITPVMHYKRTDTEVKAVAEHVFDAIHAPQLTYPQKSDKDIPGSIWNGQWQPLHRNYPKFNQASKDISTKNRTAKDAACAGLTKGENEQCDEFPLASTKEGAGKGDGNFSVRYVPQSDNSKAGARLSKWYGQDRILDGDAYGMAVD
ncbi:NucA/NucB deoxyribonuclease domain-containing protein [Streptomyces sp. R41]|uniref:NucA/NucB deoxyribonuclease domain-containing protein n=1 Tax=Streptomyces sp. R41 TaxID=3238632 RepID=A0AB39R940_9ACTN